MRLLLVALMAFASSAYAEEGRWTLVQSIGTVTVEEPGLARIAVKPDAKLNEGATVTTGTNGRAVLTDGYSSITVNANSRLELPASGTEETTSIRQDFGRALFKVQKKPTAHFEVQTPYLAAVVKGTTFEVVVDAMGATVDVEEGLVDVGATLSGERTLVPGGQRVRVLRSGRFDGGRPAGLDQGRSTTAALNVIPDEIAPDMEGPQEHEQEFAALSPRTDPRRRIQDRLFDRDRDNRAPQPVTQSRPSPVAVTAPAPEAVTAPTPVTAPALPQPSVTLPAPRTGSSGGYSTTDSDRLYDRARYAAFWDKLKKAYDDLKDKYDRDDSSYTRDRDREDRDREDRD